MVRTSTLLTAAVAAGLASAQGLNIPGVSTQCSSGVVGLVIGPLQCMKLTGLVPVLSAEGSIIPGITSYLESLCPAGPVCTPENLQSAETTINNSCAEDKNATGTGATLLTVVDGVLNHYPEFFAGICAKNKTTNAYCVPELLQTIQNETNQDVTLEYLGGLISGNASALAALTPLATSGKVCTGCLATLYYELEKANVSATSAEASTALKGQCGNNFGSSIPSDVAAGGGGSSSASASASSASQSAASASASSSAKAAAGGVSGLIVAGVSVVSVVVGAAMVL
ncbi:hypothetical protein Q8F55_009184 [Vanrija albida]|uniref:Hydrophobin n=1 Tax=Vanrija albida TaxID=181172 RepID=A0ABR3PSW9_9TREE